HVRPPTGCGGRRARRATGRGQLPGKWRASPDRVGSACRGGPHDPIQDRTVPPGAPYRGLAGPVRRWPGATSRCAPSPAAPDRPGSVHPPVGPDGARPVAAGVAPVLVLELFVPEVSGPFPEPVARAPAVAEVASDLPALERGPARERVLEAAVPAVEFGASVVVAGAVESGHGDLLGVRSERGARWVPVGSLRGKAT